MKNKLRNIIEIVIIMFFVVILILFLQNAYFSVKIKLVVLDIILILICVKYRNFRVTSKDKRRILFTIRWYGLVIIIVILTIGILIYEK